MDEWSTDNPFGAITPYHLTVEGRWKLTSAALGLLSEFVTCPLCAEQKGLIFESDSARLGELADITCPMRHTFSVIDITGHDLKARLDYLHGNLDADDRAEQWATNPETWTGPVPDEAGSEERY